MNCCELNIDIRNYIFCKFSIGHDTIYCLQSVIHSLWFIDKYYSSLLLWIGLLVSMMIWFICSLGWRWLCLELPSVDWIVISIGNGHWGLLLDNGLPYTQAKFHCCLYLEYISGDTDSAFWRVLSWFGTSHQSIYPYTNNIRLYFTTGLNIYCRQKIWIRWNYT